MTLRGIFLIVFVSFCIFASPNPAETASGGSGIYTVKDITWNQEQNSWIYKISGSRIPTYTRYELFSPHRLRLDIAEGDITGGLSLPLEPEKGPVSEIRGKTVQDKEVEIARVELVLKEDVEYKVQNKGSDINVKISGSEGVEEQGKTAEKGDKPLISDISFKSKPEGVLVKIDAGRPIHSAEATAVEGDQDSPPHLIIDLDDVGTEELLRMGGENSLISRVRAESHKDGSRLLLYASGSKLFDYDLLTSENGLHIEVQAPVSETEELLAAITNKAGTKKKVSERQPREISPRAQKDKKNKGKEPGSRSVYDVDQFSRAGYKGEEITVDFYQSNLHNVFRLIGEVSGRNIIVAEGVSGTLTLSLKGVPWDFLLDIVLNLKNLNKEEQFNTIIISPASKKFEWPGQDEKEGLVINRPATVSRETEESKGKMEVAKLLRRAKSMEDVGNHREALTLYEKVLKLEPDRGDIAAKITSLALSKIGLNAKAAHYGRIASRLKPEDSRVALLTATALAKIGKPKEAVKYYEHAISGSHPSGQALAAYAAFSEEYKSYEMALELWNKYEENYGASLETMVTRARISDLLGRREKAAEIYQRVEMSGYEIPSDLAEYIDHRLKD